MLVVNLSFGQCGGYTEVVTQRIEKIRFWDDMNGFAFGGTKLMTTNDGGESWKDFKLPDFETLFTKPLLSAQIINETSAIVVGHNGHILFTTDKGITWNYQSLQYDGFEDLTTVSFVNNEIGYIGGFNDIGTELIIFKTTNAGVNWKKISTSLNINKLEIGVNETNDFNFHFINDDIGLLWKGNKLFRTENGGVIWKEDIQFSSQTTNFHAIMKVISAEDDHVYLSRNSSQGMQVLKSTDYGLTWEIIEQLQSTTNSLTSGNIAINGKFLYGEVYSDIYYKKKLIKYNLTTSQFELKDLEDDLGAISDIFFYEENKGVLVASPLFDSTAGRTILQTMDSGSTYSTLDSFSAKSNTIFRQKVLLNEQNILTAAVNDQFDSNYQDNNYAFYLHISKNNGDSWQQIVKKKYHSGALLYANNSHISYYTYGFENPINEPIYLMKSVDYGISWTETIFNFPPHINGTFSEMTTVDENTFVYEDYFSIDKGQTWTKLELPTVEDGTVYYTKYKSINEIYVWGKMNDWPNNYDYFLYKSTNQGLTWTQVVTIPDNNGSDLGVNAATIVFGSNYALVSTGGNTYYKVNLEDNSYQIIPFIHPYEEVNFYESEIFLISDTFWFLTANYQSFPVISYTKDQGATWDMQLCLTCASSFIYNPFNSEIISYGHNDLFIGKIAPYIPPAPNLFGNTIVPINSTEEYFIPVNFFSEPVWEVLSGGEIIPSADSVHKFYKIKIKWTESGDHQIKVFFTNNCGESAYTYFTVSVLPTDINEILNTATAFPNPFSDKITIQFRQKFKSFRAEISNILGAKVLGATTTIEANKVSLENIGHLSSGVYFIKISDNGSDKYQMIKVLKE